MRQHEFTFRKVFAVCLLVMVAQTGLAGDWDGNEVTYDFSRYQDDFTLTGGSVLCETIGDKDLYTMEDRNGNTFHHALDAIFAAQNVNHWSIATDGTGRHLYQGGNGNRYLSISNLFQNVTIKIDYNLAVDGTKTEEERSIKVVDDSYISGSLTNHVLISGRTYTLAKNGPLDLDVPRWVKIRKITINYTNHPLIFKRANERIVYYKDNKPYFRCQLSSRNFVEPDLMDSESSHSFVASELAIATIETYNGYAPAVFKTYEGENNTHPIKIEDGKYDVMMNNEGVSEITVTYSGKSDSYRLEIWDYDASTSVTDITNGKKFQITGPGVLHNRTITSVPGIEVNFSTTNDGTEPNTTVAFNESGHIVAFTNDNYGWWDRAPHDNYSWPNGGTFYSFKATAKGRLKFGGVKINSDPDHKGRVYFVKLVNEGGVEKYPKAFVFQSEQSGYLDNNHLSPTYNEYVWDGTEERWVEVNYSQYYNISTTNGIELKTGDVYYLQGESGGAWSPYLMEWFSYEMDNTLNVNKTFTVADQTGYSIRDNGNYTASDVTVVGGNAEVGWYVDNVWTLGATQVKGSISSAKVEINNGHLKFYDIDFDPTGQNNMGGAIKTRIRTAEDNYIDFTLTIPYGKHVWDFRSTADQEGATRPGAWSKTDAELCTMMKTNTSTGWKLVWKVRKNDLSEMSDPIMAADGSINGDNAFWMDNTAGLVFVTGARSFGAHDTRSTEGVSNSTMDTWTAAQTTTTNLLWVKGNATVYFPGVTAGQYIKIYTYRHSDDKGETFSAKNLVDLDNNNYDPNNKFIMRGMWEERYPAYKGDNIKGCAIFRVPTLPTTSNPLDNIPQLTLCDDGWMKIYRIEIMDEFEPDIILTDDNPGGAFCPVDYDGKFGSVVVRKKNGTNVPTLKSYTATVGQTQCQHANTCDYQIIADAGVVDINKEVWTSGGGVNYNRLNLKYNKSGLVRIVQRERVCLVGSNNNWAETGKDGEGNLTYEDIATASRPTGYVIDKNEYYVNVGELTVQDYPYTWDFSDYNMYKGSSTKSNLNGKDWTVSENTCSQKAVASPKIDFGVGTGQTQNLKIDKALFPQGAQLMSNDGIVVAETEGLGVSRPTKTKTYYYYSTVNNVFDKRERNYDGYTLEDYAIKMDGNDLTGIGEITIPDVDNGMYVFVKSSAAPTSITGASVPGTDPFNKADGVYLYQNNGVKQDVVLSFAASTTVEIVAVTDIVKTINNLGYASESRDRAIDHTYEGVLTTNDVNAYIITTEDEYGKTYNFKGYPMVKKTRVTTDIVPANMGIVLYKAGHTGGSFSSPLFVPAVNNVPAYDAANSEFWLSNWMIPNVQSKQHYNEETSRSAAAETSIIDLPYYDNGNIRRADWNMKQTTDATIFGSYSSDPVRYVDLSGFKELRIYQSNEHPAVRCFFYNTNGSPSVTITTPQLVGHEIGTENGYYSLNLKDIYDTYGQVKLIGIKAATSDGRAYVSDVKALSYVNPDPTWCTKFVMTTSYYTYSDITGTFSGEKTATMESFYRMILDKNESTAATNNTLGANKALLLIPRDKLPEALWNKTPGSGGSGARRGVIYIDLDDFEEQEATSVASETIINRSTDDDVYYSISGTRINGKPTTKGFYIHNGKKVSVR